MFKMINTRHSINRREKQQINNLKDFKNVRNEISCLCWSIPDSVILGLRANWDCGLECIVSASLIGCGLLLASLVLVVTWWLRGRRRKGVADEIVLHRLSLSALPSERRVDAPDAAGVVDARWEFPRSRLRLLSVVGEGEFGRVMKAHALDIAGSHGYSTVAVKMLKENGGLSEKQDLISEFNFLKEISHPNVIKLLGASTDNNGPLYVIVEFAELGSLRSYLRKRRRHNSCGAEAGRVSGVSFPCERSRAEPHHLFFHKEQLSFAWQIAKGMAYLSGLKLVHRDLAARNVLLAKMKIVKISDFGLSRDIYEGDAYLKKTKGRVPVKWMAIESLEDHIYTSRSDVWSFGIVLWEIMMQGASPYPGVTPHRLYNLLKAGYRMSKPDACSEEMYNIMRQCWKVAPRDRPSFKELVIRLDAMLQDTVEYVDLSLNPSGDSNTYLQRKPKTEVPTLQYITVADEDDRHVSDLESQESMGLGDIFEQPVIKELNGDF